MDALLDPSLQLWRRTTRHRRPNALRRTSSLPNLRRRTCSPASSVARAAQADRLKTTVRSLAPETKSGSSSKHRNWDYSRGYQGLIIPPPCFGVTVQGEVVQPFLTVEIHILDDVPLFDASSSPSHLVSGSPQSLFWILPTLIRVSISPPALRTDPRSIAQLSVPNSLNPTCDTRLSSPSLSPISLSQQLRYPRDRIRRSQILQRRRAAGFRRIARIQGRSQ